MSVEQESATPLSVTFVGLAPGETPCVRLTFDAPCGIDGAIRLAHQYAGIGLGVQARMLDAYTVEVVLG